MKNLLLQNAVVQSLVASLLCGLIVLSFLHQPSVFEQDGEITLMPKVTSSVRDCPLPSPQLAADGKLKLLLEDKAFFESFFPAIQKEIEKYGLKDLHTQKLPVGDLELRVWELPSFYPASFFVLRRTGGEWSALQVKRLVGGEVENSITNYPEPKIGWSEFWNSLVQENILTLPDCSCLRDYNWGKDGITYLVEINLNGAYRAYHYWAPQSPHQVLPEGKHMWKIIGTIFSYSVEEPAR